MAIFNKEKREERQQEKATKKEERATMKRAEALASTIDKKSTEDIPSFDAKKEEERVMKSKQPGLTVVEGGNPMTNEEQKVTRFSPEQAKEIEKKEESKVQTYRGPVASIINATQAITANSDALKQALSNDKQNIAVNSALNADKNAKTEVLGSITDPNTTLKDVEKISADADAVQGEIQKEQTNLVNATSKTLGSLGEQKQKPDYNGFATKEDVKKGIDDYMAEYAKNAPANAIEKLGVQDYYPQVGRDVAVGTFTGSRIGSQTIYSGAGVLLPQGLYDARKRALTDAAKQRQKDLDKYLTIANTADQFNERFAEIAGKAVYDVAERNGFNPNRIGRDREGMIELKKIENRGKRIIEADKQIDAFLEASNPKDGKPQAFVPPKMKDEMYKFKNGLIDNVDDYLTGKKDIGEFLENFRIYSNGTIWIDENFPKWTNESNKTQRSISLKTGKELTDQNIKEINETIKALQNDGNPDYDTYASVLKKYFSIDDKRVDAWMDLQGYPKDELARESIKEYLNNLIPAASFVEEIKGNPNQNFGRWSKKMDLAIEKEKSKSFFTIVQDEAKRLNVSGKAAAISNNWNNKSQDQKQNELAGIYNGLGIVTKNPNNKKDAYAEIKVDTKTAIGRPVTISLDDPNAKIRLRKVGGGYGDVSIGDAARNLYDKESTTNEIWVNGVKYSVPRDSNDYTSISNAKKNKGIVVIDKSKKVRLGHYGSDGNLYNLSTDNLNNYVKSNKKTLNVEVEGNSAIEVEVPDYEENGKTFYKTELQPSSSVIIYKGDLDNTSFKALADYTQGVGQQSYVGGDVKQSVEK